MRYLHDCLIDVKNFILALFYIEHTFTSHASLRIRPFFDAFIKGGKRKLNIVSDGR